MCRYWLCSKGRRGKPRNWKSFYEARAKSWNEIMIMLFRGKHMGNGKEHALCSISQFSCELTFFFAVSVISYSTHKINLRRVSVRLFPWLSPLSYDSNADSRFMMLASLLSPSFLPTLPSNNHSWYSGVICLTRERCCGGLEVMIHASEDNEIQGDGEEIAQKRRIYCTILWFF